MQYAKVSGKSFKKDILGYSEEASSIAVLDFIISNTDRHDQNYGFWMDNDTGMIVGLSPLFDFNCALVSDVFNRDSSDTLSQMFNDGRTLRQLAYEYKPYCKLVLDLIKFNTVRKQYKEFDYVFDNILKRCEELEIKTI